MSEMDRLKVQLKTQLQLLYETIEKYNLQIITAWNNAGLEAEKCNQIIRQINEYKKEEIDPNSPYLELLPEIDLDEPLSALQEYVLDEVDAFSTLHRFIEKP